MSRRLSLFFTCAAAVLSISGTAQAQAVLTNGDGIIRNSLCVGFDCQAGIFFSDSTIIAKENNTRIKFADTSVSSFPRNDWEIEANSSLNGGPSYLGFNDCGFTSEDGGCQDKLVFAVEAGARTSALFVQSDGDIGVGTGNPVLDLHIVTGNTPAIRLEQDGSSGFTPQTWDIAGNETNFFIRDVTNASRLPFRIQPGAPSNSIFIAPNGNVGIGTSAPAAPLEVSSPAAFAFYRLTATGAPTNKSVDVTFTDGGTGGQVRFNIVDGDPQEMSLDKDGNMILAGTLITTGGGGACTVADPCDAVFDPAAYTVPSIEQHAALMWDNKYLPAVGPTKAGEPINVTTKLTRMLNELEHAHIYIEQLNSRLTAQDAMFAARLDSQSALLETQSAEIEALKALVAKH